MAEKLKEKLEFAMKELPRGPNNSAIGQVIEDCALVHVDYLASIDMAAHFICEALSEITGERLPEISTRLRPDRKCDCPARGCAGPEEAQKKRTEYLAHLLADLTPEFKAAIATQPERADN